MMPPKSTLPMRHKGSSPVTLVIFPGMARHIFCGTLRFGTDYGKDLSQRNAAVVGRNALMPIGPKPFLFQPLDRSLCEIAVLKTAARQCHPLFANAAGGGNDGFHQGVVKLR